MGSDGVAPGAADFELMLRAFGDRCQFDAADEAFDEMLLRGLVPGVASYNVYVAALWKNLMCKTAQLGLLARPCLVLTVAGQQLHVRILEIVLAC
jgi:pentatricopeptide repeat protein